MILVYLCSCSSYMHGWSLPVLKGKLLPQWLSWPRSSTLLLIPRRLNLGLGAWTAKSIAYGIDSEHGDLRGRQGDCGRTRAHVLVMLGQDTFPPACDKI